MTDPIASASVGQTHRHYSWLLFAISLGLLGWVLWRADFGQLFKYLRSGDYNLILISIPIILVGLLLRAIRWRVLLLPLGSPSIGISFSSMMLGYLANNLLPMRAGEVVRAYALGRQSSISKSAVLATIVVERAVDGIIMILVFCLLFRGFRMPSWLRVAAMGSGVVFLG